MAAVDDIASGPIASRAPPIASGPIASSLVKLFTKSADLPRSDIVKLFTNSHDLPVEQTFGGEEKEKAR